MEPKIFHYLMLIILLFSKPYSLAENNINAKWFVFPFSFTVASVYGLTKVEKYQKRLLLLSTIISFLMFRQCNTKKEMCISGAGCIRLECEEAFKKMKQLKIVGNKWRINSSNSAETAETLEKYFEKNKSQYEEKDGWLEWQFKCFSLKSVQKLGYFPGFGHGVGVKTSTVEALEHITTTDEFAAKIDEDIKEYTNRRDQRVEEFISAANSYLKQEIVFLGLTLITGALFISKAHKELSTFSLKIEFSKKIH